MPTITIKNIPNNIYEVYKQSGNHHLRRIFNVERLNGDITVVVIAHRLSTISRADQVVLLDQGQVMETGTWHELLQSPEGRLRALTEGQPNLLY